MSGGAAQATTSARNDLEERKEELQKDTKKKKKKETGQVSHVIDFEIPATFLSDIEQGAGNRDGKCQTFFYSLLSHPSFYVTLIQTK